MKRKIGVVVGLALVFAALLLPALAFADSPSPAAAQNQLTVDVTLRDDGYMTVAGIDLKQLNVAPLALDPQFLAVTKDMQSVHVVLQGETVTADVRGTPVLKIQWNPDSRKVVTELAAKYGYYVSPDVMARVEQWITTSNLDVTARFTNEASKPPVIKLAKPLWVDLGQNGEVAVEKGPLAYGIDPSVMSYVKLAGVKNATACWNKGTLNAQVDGKALPIITVDPQGAQYLTKALNLLVTNVAPFFDATVGVDVSLPGGAHQANATCGQ